MGNLGLMGIPAPAKYGGAEMDFISYILAIEEISKVSATVGVILAVHTSVGMNPILYFGTEEQKKNMFLNLQPGIFRRICFNRAKCRIGCRSLKSRAVKKGDHYIINGSKVFITNGGEASTYIVFASTNPDAGKSGISAFIVERYTWFNHRKKMNIRWGFSVSRTVQLTFEDMKVPAEIYLGKKDKDSRWQWRI